MKKLTTGQDDHDRGRALLVSTAAATAHAGHASDMTVVLQ
jgi:hypothetical protein